MAATPKRSPVPPPPPDDELDMEELGERDLPPEGGLADDDESATRGWFREALGATGVGDPRDQKATKLVDQLSSTPIHAAGDVDGAVQWLVEKRNDETGEADYIGYARLNVSLPSFIKRFLPSMPKAGEATAQFYFTPLDKTGAKLGAPGKPKVTNIPWDNQILRELRESQPAQATAQDAVAQLLREQMERDRQDRDRMEKRLEAAEERARAAQDAATKDRLAQANTIQSDLSAAYTHVGQVQTQGFDKILTASERIAADREKREEERAKRAQQEEDQRRQRDRDDREAERQKARDEAKAEADRIRAENVAALERVRVEGEARLKEIEAKTVLEEKRIAAQVEQAKIAASAEADRIRADRDREDNRRKDETAREEKRREDEEKRRSDFALQMEKIRQDARQDDRQRQDAESKRQDEHVKAVLAIYERGMTGKGAGDNKWGVLGEVLDGLNLTPSEALEKAKEFLGSSDGLGATIAKGVLDLLKEGVKRFPIPDEEDEDEDEDEGEEDESEEDESEDAEERRPARIPERVQNSGLGDFLKKRTPEPAGETPQAETTHVETTRAAPPQTPAVPLAEARAGRQAVDAMVTRLDGVEPAKWGEAIMAGQDVDALVRYVQTVGLRVALDGYDVDPDRVGAVLVAIGLFEAPPLDPTPGGAVEKPKRSGKRKKVLE